MILRTLIWLVLAAVAPAAPEKHRFQRPLMGTKFSITCYAESEAEAKKASDLAFAEAEAINEIASDWIADSELLKISEVDVGVRHKLSPRLFALLLHARSIAERTHGAYDPTLGPLTRLWRITRRSKKLPDPAVLAKAKAACGWESFTLDEASSTITLMKAGMRFDLGGMAKGYAADRMLEIMDKEGFPSSLIAAGGDIRMGIAPPGRFTWNVALQSFDANAADEIVPLALCAVSTSGDLHQWVEIEGVRYSHILDPETGLGLTERISVSVIAPLGKLSDPLATAACVVGPEKAEALVKAAGATDLRVRTME